MKRKILLPALCMIILSSGCELKLCKDGQIECVLSDTEEPPFCSLATCVDGEWDLSRGIICEFGFDPEINGCIDPCGICGTSGLEVCPEIIYNKTKNVAYRCYDAGWTRDVSCLNDYHVGKQVELDTEKINIFRQKSAVAFSINPNDDFYSATCGECSTDNSPDYFVKSGERCVHHQCGNGAYHTEYAQSSELCQENGNILNCSDPYKSDDGIFVDITNNRFHCGACNAICGAGEVCENKECKSAIVCEDGYATLQLGSRWIKAKCINDLSEIDDTDEENFDNAFVLIGDEVVDTGEEWTPFESFSGYLFGNHRTIRIKNFKQDAKVGLFKSIDNAYVSDLTLVYSGEADISARYFGLLAGTARKTVLSNITYSNEGHSLVIHKTVAAGGLIGKANNIRMSDIHLSMDLKGQDDCLAGAGETGCRDDDGPGIGGLIGVAIDIDSIANVYPLKDKSGNTTPIKLSGYRNAGGLIGSIIQKSKEGTIKNAQDDAFDVDITGYIDNIGGAFGIISCPDGEESNAITVEGVNINKINFIFGGDKDGDYAFKNIPERVGRYKSRNFGGYIGAYGLTQNVGNGYKLSVSDVVLKEIFFDDTQYTECVFETDGERCSSRMGGMAGYIKGAVLSDVKVGSIKISENLKGKEREVRAYLGGFSGSSLNSKYEHCGVDDVDFNFNQTVTSVGGFIGYSKSNQIDNCYVDACEMQRGVKWIGEAGCLVGNSVENDIIRNCTVDSFYIDGNQNVGGLIGRIDKGQIEHTRVGLSKSDNNIIFGNKNIAGFVGRIADSNIESSEVNYYSLSSKSLQTENEEVQSFGGVAGYAENSSFTKSSSKGNVISSQVEVGGFIGDGNGIKVDNCHSTINNELVGIRMIGGFIGSVYGSSQISNSDSKSAMIRVNNDIRYQKIGHSQCAGFVGRADNTNIYHSKALGDKIDCVTSVGGFIGVPSNRVKIQDSMAIIKHIQAYSSFGGFAGWMGPTGDLSVRSSSVYANVEAIPCEGEGTLCIHSTKGEKESKKKWIGGFFGDMGDLLKLDSSYTSSVVSLSDCQTECRPYIGIYSYGRYILIDNDNYTIYQTKNTKLSPLDVAPVSNIAYNPKNNSSMHDFFDSVTDSHTCQCSMDDGFSLMFDTERVEDQFRDAYMYDNASNMCQLASSENDELNQGNKIECNADTSHSKWHFVTCKMDKFKQALDCHTGCDDLIKQLCHSETECSDFKLPIQETDVTVTCDEEGNLKCAASSKPWCETGTPSCKDGVPTCGSSSDSPKCLLLPEFCG